MGRSVLPPYTPEQIAILAQALEKAIEQIAYQEEVMRRAQIKKRHAWRRYAAQELSPHSSIRRCP